MRSLVLSVLALAFTSAALAQQPDAGPLVTPAYPTELTPAADAPLAVGQQHWVGIYLSLFQPTVGTVQVTLFRRGDVSFAAEIYGGSELVELMYGGGARAIWTAASNHRSDALLIKPGLGLHVFPESRDGMAIASWWGPERWLADRKTSRTYLALDAEFSWLHDFSDHFAWEMGVKVGVAGRITGQWGNRHYRPTGLTFGTDAFPIANLFWGFRF